MKINYALEPKIPCNGIKPTKAEVYTLAAELVDTHGIVDFTEVVLNALASYDYDYYYYEYFYAYHDYDYFYAYHDYDYSCYSMSERVIALLFLAAVYSN